MLCRAMKLLRANHQVHVRQPVNQLLPAGLGHAAHEAKHHVGPAPAGFGNHVFHLPQCFLFGRIPHAAGVEQNHVGGGLGRSEGVALRDELGGDGFAVPLIHLASVGLDINARHVLPMIAAQDTTDAAVWKAEREAVYLDML